jgi:hypothetical protein
MSETSESTKKEFVYPREATEHARVLWFMDTNGAGKAVGRIIKCKRNSCDISCETVDGGIERHYDCRHADDPSVPGRKQIQCVRERGLFIMDPKEIADQQMAEEFPKFRDFVLKELAELKEIVANGTPSAFRKTEVQLPSFRRSDDPPPPEVAVPSQQPAFRRPPGRPRKDATLPTDIEV